MQIDFSQVITGYDGKPLLESKAQGQPPEPVTLRDVAIAALNRHEAHEQINEVETLKRFALSLRIIDSKGDGPDLKAEEIALLKQRIGKIMPNPVVVGRSFHLLDPPPAS